MNKLITKYFPNKLGNGTINQQLGQKNKLKGNGMQELVLYLLGKNEMTLEEEQTLKQIAERHKILLKERYTIKNKRFAITDGDVVVSFGRYSEKDRNHHLYFDKTEFDKNKQYKLFSMLLIEKFTECSKCGKRHSPFERICMNETCNKLTNYNINKRCPGQHKGTHVLKKITTCKCGTKIKLLKELIPTTDCLKEGTIDEIKKYLIENYYIFNKPLSEYEKKRPDGVIYDKDKKVLYLIESKNKENTGIGIHDVIQIKTYIDATTTILNEQIPLILIYNGFIPFEFIKNWNEVYNIKITIKEIYQFCKENNKRNDEYINKIIISTESTNAIKQFGKCGEYYINIEYTNEEPQHISMIIYGKPLYNNVQDVHHFSY